MTALVPAALLAPSAEWPVVARFMAAGRVGDTLLSVAYPVQPVDDEAFGHVCDLALPANFARGLHVLATAEGLDASGGVIFERCEAGWRLFAGGRGVIYAAAVPVSDARFAEAWGISLHAVPALAGVATAPEALAVVLVARVGVAK